MKIQEGKRYKIRTWRSIRNGYRDNSGYINPGNYRMVFIKEMSMLCGEYTGDVLRCCESDSYLELRTRYINCFIEDYMVDWTAPPLE